MTSEESHTAHTGPLRASWLLQLQLVPLLRSCTVAVVPHRGRIEILSQSLDVYIPTIAISMDILRVVRVHMYHRRAEASANIKKQNSRPTNPTKHTTVSQEPAELHSYFRRRAHIDGRVSLCYRLPPERGTSR